MGHQRDDENETHGRMEDRHDADHDPTSGEVTDMRAVSTVPLDTEDGGQVVITQQNMAGRQQVGGGEFKEPDRGRTPEQAAADQQELERDAPIDTRQRVRDIPTDGKH